METNWKKIYTSDYLGSWDLESESDTVVTIDSFKIDKVQANESLQSKSDVITIKLKEFDKPMIVNRTNAKAITKVTGSYDMKHWIGRTIALHTKLVKAFGDEVMALRVRTYAPKTKVKPVLTDDRFNKAVEGIKAGTVTKDQLEKYQLTESQINIINTIK